jgi:hypothetical protein
MVAKKTVAAKNDNIAAKEYKIRENTEIILSKRIQFGNRKCVIIFMTIDNRIKEELLHQFLFLLISQSYAILYNKNAEKFRAARLNCSLRNNQGSQHNFI